MAEHPVARTHRTPRDTDDGTPSITAPESILIDILIRHSDPVAATLIRWLITGEHTARDVTIDLAWPQPGTPNPVP